MESRAQGSRQGQGHKKIRGQGQPFRGQTLSGTGILEAKVQGHRRKCSPNKFFFLAISKKRSSKKFLLVLELRSRRFYVQAYTDDLAVVGHWY